MPSIVNKTRGMCTLDYKNYLKKCRVTRRTKINNRFKLKKWGNLLTSVSSEEIILKRWQLELKIQEGINALVQAQILDSLIMDRNNDDEEEKLKFDTEYENSTYLLQKFTASIGIVPETKAYSTYQNKYMQSIKNLIKRKLPYIPQGAKDEQLAEISFIAKAEALSEMQNCKVVCDNDQSNFYINNNDFVFYNLFFRPFLSY